MSHQAFGDVEQFIADQRGVLDGDAFRTQERIVEKMAPDGSGYTFQLYCQTCGRPCLVTVPWNELIVASMGLVPEDMQSRMAWVVHDGVMYPPVRCSCANPLYVPMTPDKADRLVQTGIKANRLDAARVAQYKQQMRARAGR